MEQIVKSQRDFFNSHQTIPLDFRIGQLKKLKQILKENEEELFHAIEADFRKSSYETYISELLHVYVEINKACRNLRKWSRPRRTRTDTMNLPGKSYMVPVPFGVVLVIGTWNFPFMLSLVPAISALAAGNTVILKPSELADNVSRIIAKLVNDNFSAQYFHAVEGGIPETTGLLNQQFDKIFFTGSTAVGKIVYQAAAKNLTPVTLELGGKNPVLICEDGNLRVTARRLVWAKFLNSGQGCVSPDYVMVPRSIKGRFLKMVVEEIEKSQFAYENSNYVQIINESHTRRLIDLIDKEKIYYGGRYDLPARHIEPTLLEGVQFGDRIMQEEIFGPLMPFIEYDNLDEAIALIKSLPAPLSFYAFTRNKKTKERILREIPFGGGAFNDSVMYFINNNLPFGGVGSSGMGAYHGHHGFKAFSHYKGILDRATWFETSLKYFPHTLVKLKIIKRILEI